MMKNRFKKNIRITKVSVVILSILVLIGLFGWHKSRATASISKEPSYMYAVLKDIPIDNDKILERIQKEKESIIKSQKTKENTLILEISHDNIIYNVAIQRIMDMIIPDYLVNIHDIDQEEYNRILKMKNSIGTSVIFADDNMKSYHFQIKLLNIIAPEMLSVVDFNAYKMLGKKWIDLTAKSQFAPSPSYITTIFTMNKNDDVWVYSAGLRRCGSLEIEIINSDIENYGLHYSVLDIMSGMIVGQNKLGNSKEAMHIGANIFFTWIPTQDALKGLKNDSLGSLKDGENGAYQDTAIIFPYLNEENAKKKKISNISEVNELLKKESLYYISDEETERMSGLAAERWDYVVRALQNPKMEISMKFGIPTADAGIPNESKEHMWFLIKEIKEDKIIGVLNNFL